MIVTLQCPCGRATRASTLLQGALVVCADCGMPNAPRVPVAAAPAEYRATPVRIGSDRGMFPEWFVAPILAYLTYVGSVIIAIGWCFASTNDLSINAQAFQTPRKEPAKTQFVSAPAPPVPEVTEEPRGEVEAHTRTMNESFTLPRRAHIPVDEPANLPIHGMDESADPPIAPPPPTVRKTRDGMAIEWSLDARPKKSSELFLILPVEVANVTTGNLHYSLRRLRLADDAPKPLKLAVTPPAHDDIGSILNKMGPGYRFTSLRNHDLLSLPMLRHHDVVFLTCADMYVPDFQAAMPLRKFVELGGTLYASDLRGDLLLAAFPEFRARMPVYPGIPQQVDVAVVDPGLQAQVGRKTVPLTFDAPGWRPAPFDASRVTVCLTGQYRNQRGELQSAPLLVKFQVGRGTVIFTSFHHTKNDSEIVRRLLDYLVFASVNARSEARVRELMQRYDFAPADLRPTTLNTGQDAQGTFEHPGGGLQIALGFENQGAKLKLTLRAPTGQMVEHEDQGIYLVEVPNAPSGSWKYTVTPIDLPHANFPMIVAIGTLKHRPADGEK